MTLVVTISPHETAANRFEYHFSDNEIVIGGDIDAQIQLPGRFVAARHLKLRVENAGLAVCSLVDDGSVRLNGAAVPTQRWIGFGSTDRLELAHYRIEALLAPQASDLLTTPDRSSEMAQLMAQQLIAIYGSIESTPTFTVTRGDQLGVRYRFARSMPEAVIGRDPSCDIFINDESLSRAHARVRWDRGRAWVVDLGSKHGVCHNGLPVATAALEDGDILRIGETELTFRDLRGAPAEGLTADFAPHGRSRLGARDWILLGIAALFLGLGVAISLYLWLA